jgi:hypothetical protein
MQHMGGDEMRSSHKIDIEALPCLKDLNGLENLRGQREATHL